MTQQQNDLAPYTAGSYGTVTGDDRAGRPVTLRGQITEALPVDGQADTWDVRVAVDRQADGDPWGQVVRYRGEHAALRIEDQVRLVGEPAHVKGSALYAVVELSTDLNGDQVVRLVGGMPTVRAMWRPAVMLRRVREWEDGEVPAECAPLGWALWACNDDQADAFALQSVTRALDYTVPAGEEQERVTWTYRNASVRTFAPGELVAVRTLGRAPGVRYGGKQEALLRRQDLNGGAW
jgi:hypothetical protein